jgi:hypothetical protein
MVNGEKKEFSALPILKEEYDLVKQKQIELTAKRNRMVTLSEISSELIKKGLHLIE